VMGERSQPGVPWAGLAAGAAAWAISTQLNYIFATVHCEAFTWPRAATALATLAICVGGVVLSWLAWISSPNAMSITDKQPRQLIAGISVLAGTIFGLAILAQALALVILGCKQ
jgi:hypothetical protein